MGPANDATEARSQASPLLPAATGPWALVRGWCA